MNKIHELLLNKNATIDEAIKIIEKERASKKHKKSVVKIKSVKLKNTNIIDVKKVYKVISALETGHKYAIGDIGTSYGPTQQQLNEFALRLGRDPDVSKLTGISSQEFKAISKAHKDAKNLFRGKPLLKTISIDTDGVKEYVRKNPKMLSKRNRMIRIIIPGKPTMLAKKTSRGYVGYVWNYDFLSKYMSINNATKKELDNILSRYITRNVNFSAVAKLLAEQKNPELFRKFTAIFDNKKFVRANTSLNQAMSNIALRGFQSRADMLTRFIQKSGYDTNHPNAYDIYQLFIIMNTGGHVPIKKFLFDRKPFPAGNLVCLRRGNKIISKKLGIVSKTPTNDGLDGFPKIKIAMKTLSFPQAYADQIKDGGRTFTIRLENYGIEPGDIIRAVTDSGSHFCNLAIEEVKKMTPYKIGSDISAPLGLELEEKFKFSDIENFYVIKFYNPQLKFASYDGPEAEDEFDLYQKTVPIKPLTINQVYEKDIRVKDVKARLTTKDPTYLKTFYEEFSKKFEEDFTNQFSSLEDFIDIVTNDRRMRLEDFVIDNWEKIEEYRKQRKVSKLTQIKKIAEITQTYSHDDKDYDVDKLIEITKDCDVKEEKVSKFKKNLNEEMWSDSEDNKISLQDVLDDRSKYKKESKGIKDVTFKNPILVWKNDIVDGNHRLAKAFDEEKETIDVIYVTDGQMASCLKNYIDFPKSEQNDLKKRLKDDKEIYTTRVSDEQGKYEKDDILQSPLGKLKVKEVKTYKKLEDHPFIDELTDKQKKQIDEEYDLVELKKIARRISVNYLQKKYDHVYKIIANELINTGKSSKNSKYFNNEDDAMAALSKPPEYIRRYLNEKLPKNVIVDVWDDGMGDTFLLRPRGGYLEKPVSGRWIHVTDIPRGRSLHNYLQKFLNIDNHVCFSSVGNQSGDELYLERNINKFFAIIMDGEADGAFESDIFSDIDEWTNRRHLYGCSTRNMKTPTKNIFEAWVIPKKSKLVCIVSNVDSIIEEAEELGIDVVKSSPIGFGRIDSSINKNDLTYDEGVELDKEHEDTDKWMDKAQEFDPDYYKTKVMDDDEDEEVFASRFDRINKVASNSQLLKRAKDFALYHYGPKDIDLQEDGVKSPKELAETEFKDEVIDKYKGRAKSNSIDTVLEYLEERRGEGGSRAISALIAPIPDDKLEDYTEAHNLYKIDYYKALEDGVIEKVMIVEETPGSIRVIEPEDIEDEIEKLDDIDWTKEKKLLFSEKPHFFLILKNGVLPGKYIIKEQNLDDNFPTQFDGNLYGDDDEEIPSGDSGVITNPPPMGMFPKNSERKILERIWSYGELYSYATAEDGYVSSPVAPDGKRRFVEYIPTAPVKTRTFGDEDEETEDEETEDEETEEIEVEELKIQEPIEDPDDIEVGENEVSEAKIEADLNAFLEENGFEEGELDDLMSESLGEMDFSDDLPEGDALISPEEIQKRKEYRENILGIYGADYGGYSELLGENFVIEPSTDGFTLGNIRELRSYLPDEEEDFYFNKQNMGSREAIDQLFKSGVTWRELGIRVKKDPGYITNRLLPIIVAIVGKGVAKKINSKKYASNDGQIWIRGVSISPSLVWFVPKEGSKKYGRPTEEIVMYIQQEIPKLLKIYFENGVKQPPKAPIMGYLSKALANNLTNHIIKNMTGEKGVILKTRPTCSFCSLYRGKITNEMSYKAGSSKVPLEKLERGVYRCDRCTKYANYLEDQITDLSGKIEDFRDSGSEENIRSIPVFEMALDGLKNQHWSAQVFADPARQHIVCPNSKSCPGREITVQDKRGLSKIPISCVDWNNTDFHISPNAERKLAQFGVKRPQQEADDSPSTSILSHKNVWNAPNELQRVPFKCPFCYTIFTPESAKGKADGWGGLFVRPKTMKWVEPDMLTKMEKDVGEAPPQVNIPVDEQVRISTDFIEILISELERQHDNFEKNYVVIRQQKRPNKTKLKNLSNRMRLLQGFISKIQNDIDNPRDGMKFANSFAKWFFMRKDGSLQGTPNITPVYSEIVSEDLDSVLENFDGIKGNEREIMNALRVKLGRSATFGTKASSISPFQPLFGNTKINQLKPYFGFVGQVQPNGIVKLPEKIGNKRFQTDDILLGTVLFARSLGKERHVITEGKERRITTSFKPELFSEKPFIDRKSIGCAPRQVDFSKVMKFGKEFLDKVKNMKKYLVSGTWLYEQFTKKPDLFKKLVYYYNENENLISEFLTKMTEITSKPQENWDWSDRGAYKIFIEEILPEIKEIKLPDEKVNLKVGDYVYIYAMFIDRRYMQKTFYKIGGNIFADRRIAYKLYEVGDAEIQRRIASDGKKRQKDWYREYIDILILYGQEVPDVLALKDKIEREASRFDRINKLAITDQKLLQESREDRIRLRGIAEREMAKIRALGFDPYFISSVTLEISIPGHSDIDIQIASKDVNGTSQKLVELGYPLTKDFGTWKIHTYFTEEDVEVDIKVRTEEQLEDHITGQEKMLAGPQEERDNETIRKYRIREQMKKALERGDTEEYNRIKKEYQDSKLWLYKKYGLIPKNEGWTGEKKISRLLQIRKLAVPSDAKVLQQLNLKELQKSNPPPEDKSQLREYYQKINEEAKEGPIFTDGMIDIVKGDIKTKLTRKQLIYFVDRYTSDYLVFADFLGTVQNVDTRFIDWLIQNEDDAKASDLDNLENLKYIYDSFVGGIASEILLSDFSTAFNIAEEWHQQFGEGYEGEVKHKAEIIKEYDDMRLVRLTTKEELDEEGKMMGHCVGSYYNDVKNNNLEIYSIRDSGGPHVTFEIQGNNIHQVKGKQNAPPVDKYLPITRKIIIDMGWDFSLNSGDIWHLKWEEGKNPEEQERFEKIEELEEKIIEQKRYTLFFSAKLQKKYPEIGRKWAENWVSGRHPEFIIYELDKDYPDLLIKYRRSMSKKNKWKLYI